MTQEPLSPTESIAHTIRAYGPNCIGCQRHGAHVMLSYINAPKVDGVTPVIHDLFLTREQAVQLRRELDGILETNP